MPPPRLTPSKCRQVYMIFKQLHEPTLDADLFVRRLLPELERTSPEQLAARRIAHRQTIERENEQRERARQAYLAKQASHHLFAAAAPVETLARAAAAPPAAPPSLAPSAAHAAQTSEKETVPRPRAVRAKPGTHLRRG